MHASQEESELSPYRKKLSNEERGGTQNREQENLAHVLIGRSVFPSAACDHAEVS